MTEDGSAIGDSFDDEQKYRTQRVVEIDSERLYLGPPEIGSQGIAIRKESTPLAFISHNKVDKPFARQLGEFLHRHGVEVWFDEWDISPGDPIIDKIEQGLERSDFFILIISPSALSSGWVREEIRAALMNKIQRESIRILPIMREAVERLPPFIEGLKYIDFTMVGKTGKIHSSDPWDDLLRAIFTQSKRPPVLDPPHFVSRTNLGKNDDEH